MLDSLPQVPKGCRQIIVDLLDVDMFKVYADMLKNDKKRVKTGQSSKFGYLPMMTVATLDVLNTESFCECVLSFVKLVVSDLHVSLKPSEIRMVMLRMNHGNLPKHTLVRIQVH